MVQKSLSKRVVVCCFGFVEVRIFGDMNAEWRAFVYVSGYSLVCQKRVIERIVSAWFYRQYGDAPEVSDNRMRERMSMKSKMLGALALLTLIGALFVMQSADQRTPTVDAATVSIDALNVGTCLTTNDDVFKGDCDILMNDADGTANDWEVRAKKTEVSTLYATYAHDPKTASDEPRAILTDSDLLEISIADSGRDKRTGVLIRGASYDGVNDNDDTGDPIGIFDEDRAGSLAAVIAKDLSDDKLGFDRAADGDLTDTTHDIVFTSDEHDGSADGIEVYQGATVNASVIGNSGNLTLNFTRAECIGDASECTATTNTDKIWQFDPGDFDVENGAEVRFYGCVDVDGDTTCGQDTSDAIKNLKDFLTVDEDKSNGEATGDTAPWLGVNVSVPTGKDIVILAIYYRTSEAEHLVGGEKPYYCGADEVENDHTLYQNDDEVWRCDDPDTPNTKENVEAKLRGVSRVDYTADEKADNDALSVQVKSDGDDTSQKLWLKETDIFSGRYHGFVRLTDSNGDRVNSDTARSNWGLVTGGATGETKEKAAVLGVESGPVTVEYTDSAGKKQTLRIEIDHRPPTISVDSPANGDSSGDQSPDFSGVIEDSDSGLVDKSFRLLVDNVANNADFVVDEPNADDVTVVSGKTVVTYSEEYDGYSDTNDTFGVVDAEDLYELGDDSCDNADHCYIESEEYDDGANRGTFDDSVRLDLQNRKGITSTDVDTRDQEFDIDFQAFVLDMAGNVGFSDSDPTSPRFINDLGTKAADRKEPNVLGYYSAHVITLDEKDPVIDADQTATGFYGRSNKKNVNDRYGIVVAFDGPIDSSSVSTSTFTVELDDKSMASVVDVSVDKEYVFLKLASELASDATPTIDIAAGEKVEDMAGNETFGKEVKAFEANDGISPKLTVTLSGGSGSGTATEGPESLTKDKITVHVASDEALQGAPRIIVACSNLRWNEDTDATEEENEVDSKHDIGDFVARHDGTFETKPSIDPVTTRPRVSNTKAAGKTYDYTCGYDSNDDNFGDDFTWTEVSSLSRPGENWEYTWQKPAGTPGKDATALADGKLTAVAFARDRSKHGTDDSMENWGSASAEFTLDTALSNPKEDGGGDLQPEDGGTSKEDRPFILIEFNENTTVTLDSVEIDDVEVSSEFEQPQLGRFVYWPQSLSKGKHEVEVEATDAAGNERSFEFSFTVEARAKFLIELQAGWNAISVPADPVDTAIGTVFSDPAIETVIGWDTQGWRIAVRRDGVWESNHQYGALNEIRAKYGYWVKSAAFIDQPVALKGPISRSLSGAPSVIGIDTNPGWNFVGVVDQQGTQTEDDFGETLKDSQDKPLTASEYLNPSYVRAYTWDPTFSRFEVLREKDTMTIGKGVWVYYPETGGIAP